MSTQRPGGWNSPHSLPRDKIQEDLLVRTLELPWLFRIPFDSVNSLGGLHLGLPGVNSVVCLQRHLIGKSPLTNHPSPTSVHTLAITFFSLPSAFPKPEALWYPGLVSPSPSLISHLPEQQGVQQQALLPTCLWPLPTVLCSTSPSHAGARDDMRRGSKH